MLIHRYKTKLLRYSARKPSVIKVGGNFHDDNSLRHLLDICAIMPQHTFIISVMSENQLQAFPDNVYPSVYLDVYNYDRNLHQAYKEYMLLHKDKFPHMLSLYLKDYRHLPILHQFDVVFLSTVSLRLLNSWFNKEPDKYYPNTHIWPETIQHSRIRNIDKFSQYISLPVELWDCHYLDWASKWK